jgi:hypothetical protein
MTRVIATLATLVALGCTTTVIVRDKSGVPVSQADVYINDSRAGATDASGTLEVALNNGDHLFARKLMYEHPSYRHDHGAGQGWAMRAYQTSLVIQNDGSRVDSTVTDRSTTQTLHLDPHNALIGVHLVVSLYWDASQDELNALRDRFVSASEYLYNLTDGQFLIEQVELADDAQLWNSAEIQFQVDNTVLPFTTYTGGFLGSVGLQSPVIRMAPFSYIHSSQAPETIIHEFGHLGFGLADEYIGFGNGPHFCTQALFSDTTGPFKRDGVQASCAMDSQIDASKLCSNHSNNPHHGGTYQFGSCWDTIRNGAFLDPGGPPGRWILQTPDTRGTIPGKLPHISAGLRPTVNITNRSLHDLCKPFIFTDPQGAAMAFHTVWVRPLFWGGDFWLGKLESNGSLEARGVHLGDIIKTWGSKSSVTVDASKCTVTN